MPSVARSLIYQHIILLNLQGLKHPPNCVLRLWQITKNKNKKEDICALKVTLSLSISLQTAMLVKNTVNSYLSRCLCYPEIHRELDTCRSVVVLSPLQLPLVSPADLHALPYTDVMCRWAQNSNSCWRHSRSTFLSIWAGFLQRRQQEMEVLMVFFERYGHLWEFDLLIRALGMQTT